MNSRKLKQVTTKSVAVAAAFLIGVAINHACGDQQGGAAPSMQELWKAVQRLQTEVSSLRETVAQQKKEIDALKSSGSGSDCVKTTDFAVLKSEVGDIKKETGDLKNEIIALKSSAGESTCGEFLVDGLWFSRSGSVVSKWKEIDYGNGQILRYTYDDKGRLESTVHTSENYSQASSSVYSGKTVTTTNEVVTGGNKTTRVFITSYY